MQFCSGLTGEQCRALDRFEFRDHGTRREKIPYCRPAVLQNPLEKTRSQFLAFGMNRDGQVQPRSLAQAFEKGQVVRAPELRQSGIAQEGFESYDSAGRKLSHFDDIARYQAAPQSEIRDGGCFERIALAIEFARVQSAGRGI